MSNSHEGTPNFYNISIRDRKLTAHAGFHYNDASGLDNVATGSLTIQLDNLSMTWEDPMPQTEYNKKLRDMGVKGHIGDRDYIQIFGRNITLQEANLVPPSSYGTLFWGSWRIFLYDHSTNNFSMLQITTHDSSTSFGNPTLTLLESPKGKTLIVTYFLFSEGAKESEAGELISHKEFNETTGIISYRNKEYPLFVTSNYTVSNLNFDEALRLLRFDATGPDHSTGFLIISFPRRLVQDIWQGNFTLQIGGTTPANLSNWSDSENTYIYLTCKDPEGHVLIKAKQTD